VIFWSFINIWYFYCVFFIFLFFFFRSSHPSTKVMFPPHPQFLPIVITWRWFFIFMLQRVFLLSFLPVPLPFASISWLFVLKKSLHPYTIKDVFLKHVTKLLWNVSPTSLVVIEDQTNTNFDIAHLYVELKIILSITRRVSSTHLTFLSSFPSRLNVWFFI
jgi:hypothetical protein